MPAQSLSHEAEGARQQRVEIRPGVSPGLRREIAFVLDSERHQLLAQPIAAPKPESVVRIAREKQVRRRMPLAHVHRRGVLPALFLAVVEFVERRALAVEFVIFQRRRQRGDGS